MTIQELIDYYLISIYWLLIESKHQMEGAFVCEDRRSWGEEWGKYHKGETCIGAAISLPNTDIPEFYFYGHMNRHVLEKTCEERLYIPGPILLTLSKTYKVRNAFWNASQSSRIVWRVRQKKGLRLFHSLTIVPLFSLYHGIFFIASILPPASKRGENVKQERLETVLG